ncbi:uncharacterized protein LOC143919849 isoform X2 [Arctopsyche grandis]|uniref:uncharacterized protein LOC143919849 isoform X2 n=1 Tax=Arctopsyche grandis TaxID=121162 RepID=UPI00406D9B74
MSEPESLTDALQSQVIFYKGEYENLKLETKSLINENVTMSKQLDELLKHKCDQENIFLHNETEKETIDGLQNQLVLLKKENESLAALWRTSQNTIQSLENELRTYQNHHRGTSVYVDTDEIKREYSAVVRALELKLTSMLEDIKSKEENIKTLLNDKENINKILFEKEKYINNSIQKESEGNIKIETLEKEIYCLRNELSACKRNSEDLQNDMEICRQNMDAYAKKESQSRCKVVEALKLVDAAIAERDTAIQKEKNTIDEKIRLSNQVTEVLSESALRVEKEVEIAKQCYNDKLNDMLIHIQRLELELGEKELSLERALRECEILEEKAQSFKKCKSSNNDEKGNTILMLEQKLEATFQQLVLSERRNIQVVSEKENLQMDFDQLTSGFQRDKRKREWEEKLHSNEINGLRIQVCNLKDTLDEAHKTIQRLQADIIFKENLEEKLAIDKFHTNKEFERHFETQRKLNSKWKESMKEMISKLEATVEDLLHENKLLKEEIDRLQK